MKVHFFKIINAICLILLFGCAHPETFLTEDRYPDIFPDYTDVTIPPNIAPLNFMVTEENTERIIVKCTGKDGKQLIVRSKQKVKFPSGKWKRMLQANINHSLLIEISVRSNGQWKQFKPFNIHVAPDYIDKYLVYRLIEPGYVIWKQMGIYQRCLESFNESPVITNRLTEGNCMNCHSFRSNNPKSMLFHMRSKRAGTYILHKDRFRKVDTGIEGAVSRGVYPAWHPSGRYIAMSTNATWQNFHAVKGKKVEVWDARSDILILDVDNDTMFSDSALMSPARFETFPAWSPDGRHLYFCSADSLPMPAYYDSLKYSLMRIEFDPENKKFARHADTIISTRQTGKSVSFPRVSPDGRFLLYTLSGYGNFTIWHKDADLFMLDLHTGKTIDLPKVNSKDTESYHTWSSNGRWFVFSSRRIDGLYTRPYFAWVDPEGNTGKPFLLPQKDPEHHTWLMKSYNVPELITDRVPVSIREIERKSREPAEKLRQ